MTRWRAWSSMTLGDAAVFGLAGVALTGWVRWRAWSPATPGVAFGVAGVALGDICAHTPFFYTQLLYVHLCRAQPFREHFFDIHLFHTHMQSHLFLMTHLSHTNLPPTALERTTLSFTRIPSTCSTLADNFFTRTFVNSCTRNSFTGNTFAYNSLQLSVLRHLNFRAFPVQIQSLFVIIGRS